MEERNNFMKVVATSLAVVVVGVAAIIWGIVALNKLDRMPADNAYTVTNGELTSTTEVTTTETTTETTSTTSKEQALLDYATIRLRQIDQILKVRKKEINEAKEIRDSNGLLASNQEQLLTMFYALALEKESLITIVNNGGST